MTPATADPLAAALAAVAKAGPDVELRDLFALQLLIAHLFRDPEGNYGWACDDAYKIADRLIKARNGETDDE